VVELLQNVIAFVAGTSSFNKEVIEDSVNDAGIREVSANDEECD
jgi:hypothetical protein